MAFVKGQSGNPGGRKRLPEEFLEAARSHTKANIERLVFWRDQDGDAQASLKATIALHEIAWGKPTQQVTGTEGGPVELLVKWDTTPFTK